MGPGHNPHSTTGVQVPPAGCAVRGKAPVRGQREAGDLGSVDRGAYSHMTTLRLKHCLRPRTFAYKCE